jgi:hypothetical protein
MENLAAFRIFSCHSLNFDCFKFANSLTISNHSQILVLQSHHIELQMQQVKKVMRIRIC